MIKQKLAAATVGVALSFVAVNVRSAEPVASISQSNFSLVYDVNNESGKYLLNENFSEGVFGNLKIIKEDKIICSSDSLFTNGFNLLARLLIVGSFVYLGGRTSSSFIERYLIISRGFIMILLSIFVSVSFIVIGIVTVSIFLFPHHISSSMRSSHNCILKNL
ncbi:hypothetical protein H6G81_33100 [Scytonema hofmannii FACHB-248]|uniref:Uncharacterized protein n=1 Tax=Scytonema hofmannii FACHB-248 TaxID=1842502 RepID=A0ABR8H1W0_9CYAN|nr:MULTISPECIES: hypothetical protein [Nostocales]MBD2609220.1 hypothetical protein [Scytonema hofmannii FACHB-248]